MFFPHFMGKADGTCCMAATYGCVDFDADVAAVSSVFMDVSFAGATGDMDACCEINNSGTGVELPDSGGNVFEALAFDATTPVSDDFCGDTEEGPGRFEAHALGRLFCIPKDFYGPGDPAEDRIEIEVAHHFVVPGATHLTFGAVGYLRNMPAADFNWDTPINVPYLSDSLTGEEHGLDFYCDTADIDWSSTTCTVLFHEP